MGAIKKKNKKPQHTDTVFLLTEEDSISRKYPGQQTVFQ
jgi:hypothetical protein